MPPGPLYNWFCVLHGAAEVFSQAASIKAAQASRAVGLCTSHITRIEMEVAEVQDLELLASALLRRRQRVRLRLVEPTRQVERRSGRERA